MKITLVRHAQVIEEFQGKYNGHIDIPLSLEGKKQAKELAKKLQNEKFDKIYCSDLLRARETLDAFDYKIKPIYTDKLREKSWGRHEGKSFEEIQADGIRYENFEQWIDALDGEDILSYKTKIEKYFYDTIFQQKYQNILIITHAGVIRTLLIIVKKCSLEKTFTLKLPYSSYITLNTKEI
ncbi:MAG: histidine phosphatase family protein [Sulfurimonas sp.]|nr:histidine phosphatase family protein [Sulfurimonas sp.]